MIIYPAIDLLDGRCVRLKEGMEDTAKKYSDKPSLMAEHWQGLGAEYLHLVNLDGAFGRARKNSEVIAGILKAISIPVQLGGGIRSLDDAARWLDLGVSRVIFGTVAVKQPEIIGQAVDQFGPERVVVGIDARDNKVAVDGWETRTERDVLDLAREMQELGAIRVVYTDVNRDGRMTGPNIENTVNLAERTGMQVIASGGFANYEHFKALLAAAGPNIDGAIVGTALYEKTVELPELNKIVQGNN